jgi:hypothetical protein
VVKTTLRIVELEKTSVASERLHDAWRLAVRATTRLEIRAPVEDFPT